VRTLHSLTLLALTAPALAQTKPAPPPEPKTAAPLPITRVSLYKNGVGFFEHSGHVTGSQSVTIDFTTDQLNDVLQSLTAIDLGGGRIAGAGYNSTTPLDQQLKALSLGLPAKTTFSGLFNTLRGTRVQITGSGAPFTGRLVDCEMHKTGPGKEATGMLEGRFLTVAADSGEIRIFQLTPTLTVTLLDTTTHTDLTQYLKVLDQNRDQGLRHLTLQDNGSGPRELHVSYISEVPIWKSTYRILFTNLPGYLNAQPTATLQGWSVVDNTTGSDWLNVQLSLIAGSPQSFIQPISTPYYARRPEIPLPEEAQLSPQTHESGDILDKSVNVDALADDTQANAITPRRTFGQPGGTGQLHGVMGGIGSESRGGPVNLAEGFAAAPARSYQDQAFASVTPQTTTRAFDDFFEYKIDQPITIRKNESALVPILQTKINADRVTLWSPNQPTPLRALWITNTSDLTLDRGSFTIVEDGSFAGEGLLDPIHPAERRLLSYAADQAVRVSLENHSPFTHITEFVVKDGWLRQISADSRTVDYHIHNAAPDPRTVVIEHPITRLWTIADTDSKPTESTPTVNRYTTLVQPNASATITLHETWKHDQNWRLLETDDAQFNIILHNAAPSPRLIAQLQPIIDAKHVVANLDRNLRDKQTQIDTLVKDQQRLRDNLSVLKGTPEERTLATRYTNELNTQEDQLAALNKDLTTLKEQRAAAQLTLESKIQSLNLDETL
jgi:hypothetical protein